MINQLIELAEELYALGQNPFEEAYQNGDAMQALAMELGQCIQEVGDLFLKYQEDMAKMKDKMAWMSARINELELKHETRH
jgi:hypothetical protein